MGLRSPGPRTARQRAVWCLTWLVAVSLPVGIAQADGPHRSHHAEGRHHFHRPHRYRSHLPIWSTGPTHKEVLVPGDLGQTEADTCRLALTRGFALVTREGDSALPGAHYDWRGACP